MSRPQVSWPQLAPSGRFRDRAAPAAALLLVLGTAMVPGLPPASASATAGQPTASDSETEESREHERRGAAKSRSADRPDMSADAKPGPATPTQPVKGEPAKGEKSESGPTKSESKSGGASASKPQTQQRPSPAETAKTSTRTDSKGSIASDKGEGSESEVNGIRPSVYTGRYYRPEYETFRRCVVHRESRGDYTVRNSSSGASGAYQFMLGTSNEVARMMDRSDLIGRPAGTWTRAEQDQAFYTLYNHGRGATHWGGSCR